MSSWVPRLTNDAPAYMDTNYVRFNYGGLNQYPARDANGWTLPNCTAWASGRQLENGYGDFISPWNSFGNAQTWWDASVGFCDRGQDPKVGAIAVWHGGPLQPPDYQHTAGHVAVIESYDPDTDTALFSNSDYSGSQYYWNTKSGHNPSLGSLYTFLGYIYPAGDPKPAWYYPIICKKRRKQYGRPRIKRRTV